MLPCNTDSEHKGMACISILEIKAPCKFKRWTHDCPRVTKSGVLLCVHTCFLQHLFPLCSAGSKVENEDSFMAIEGRNVFFEKWYLIVQQKVDWLKFSTHLSTPDPFSETLKKKGILRRADSALLSCNVLTVLNHPYIFCDLELRTKKAFYPCAWTF